MLMRCTPEEIKEIKDSLFSSRRSLSGKQNGKYNSSIKTDVRNKNIKENNVNELIWYGSQWKPVKDFVQTKQNIQVKFGNNANKNFGINHRSVFSLHDGMLVS